MATYNGRDVTILRDAEKNNMVVIKTEDGEPTVNKGFVTVYDPSEVPVKAVVKGDKPLSDTDKLLEFYRKASPKEIEENNKRKADKEAKQKRFSKYKADGLSDGEIISAEDALNVNLNKQLTASKNNSQVQNNPQVVQNPQVARNTQVVQNRSQVHTSPAVVK